MVIAGAALLWSTLLGGSASADTIAQGLIAVGLISGGIGGSALLLLLFEAILAGLAKYARLHYRVLNPGAPAP